MENQEVAAPRIVITMDAIGDVALETNMHVVEAMALIGLAEMKLKGAYFQQVAQRRETQPSILVPNYDPRIMKQK